MFNSHVCYTACMLLLEMECVYDTNNKLKNHTKRMATLKYRTGSDFSINPEVTWNPV